MVGENFKFDVLIVGGGLPQIENPLITSLFTPGRSRPDDLFLGLDVDHHGALRDHSGRPSSHLFTVGLLCKGCLWGPRRYQKFEGKF